VFTAPSYPGKFTMRTFISLPPGSLAGVGRRAVDAKTAAVERQARPAERGQQVEGRVGSSKQEASAQGRPATIARAVKTPRQLIGPRLAKAAPCFCVLARGATMKKPPSPCGFYACAF
jgi:hypothetical protein